MWRGFEQAQGWQLISTEYSSHDTQVHILKMYDLSSSIIESKLYAFKIMTISRPTSIVSTKSIQKISLKSKDINKVKTEIFALQKLRVYSSIVEVYQVLVDEDRTRQFFHSYMGKQKRNGKAIALIMEYCPNKTLYHYLHENQVNQREIIQISLQILQILNVLRECFILHRDFRSVNLMMSQQGVKLIDFDCSFIKGYSQVEHLSYPYVDTVTAPQIKGLLKQIDAQDQISSELLYLRQQKCDLYAFGTILFQMITKRQYNGTLSQIQDEGYLSVSQQLIEIMKLLLRQDPNQRINYCQLQNQLHNLSYQRQIKFTPRSKRNPTTPYTPFQYIEQSAQNTSSQSIKSSASQGDWSIQSTQTFFQPREPLSNTTTRQ